MTALSWPKDGAETDRRRRRIRFAVGIAVLVVPLLVLTLATLIVRADTSSKPLRVETTVSGTVVNASSGLGVAGAAVTVSSDFAGYAAVKTTGGTGAYSFTDVPLAPDVILRAQAPGFADSFLNGGVRLDTTGGAAATGLELLMGAGIPVAGTVTRASGGTGVNAAIVTALSLSGPVFTVVADASGAYSFSALPSGGYIFRAATSSSEDLVDQYSGGAVSQAAVTIITLTDGESLSAFDFALAIGGGISGFVTDLSDDSTVADVVITARRVDDRSAEVTAITDSDGFYRITPLQPGEYIVRAVPPSSTAFSSQIYDGALDSVDAVIVEVDAGEDTEGVDFALETGVDISGDVKFDSSGLGVSGAVVTASGFTSGEIVAIAVAGSTGAYTLSGISDGSYRLHARPPTGAGAPNLVPAYLDGATRDDASEVIVSGSPLAGNDFSLVVGGTISGTVSTTGGGAPSVYVVAAPDPASASGLGAGAITDAASAYAITGLPAGDYLVSFQSPLPHLISPEPIAVSLSSGGSFAIVNTFLGTAGSISGTVTAAVGGVPVAEALVTVESLTGDAVRMAITSTGGDYKFEGLSAGDYTVRLDAPDLGFVPEYFGGSFTLAGATPVAVVSAVETSGIDFALDATGSITGTVTTGGGSPVSGLQVTVTSLDGFDSTLSTATDLSGDYEVTGLTPGEYRVSAPGIGQGFLVQFYSGAASAESASPVVVTAGAATTGIDFDLNIGGKISGSVTRASGGAAVEGASVLAVDESTGAFNGATTMSDGTFEIVGLADGSYTVSAEAPQLGLLLTFHDDVSLGSEATAVVITSAGTAAGIDFALPFITASSPGTITGTITAASTGDPVSGATVRATGFDGGSIAITAVTAGDGTYSISGLPPDDYRVEAHALDLGLARRFYDDAPAADDATEVTVSAGGTASSIDIALEGS